jgi:hypothetical protein
MFTKCSGLKINKDKSEAIYIGVSSNFRHKCKIKWTSGDVKCLGVYINKNTSLANEHNLNCKLEKVQSIIKIWSCRHLTLKGKVTIVNSLFIPQMLYSIRTLYSKMGHNQIKKNDNKLYMVQQTS